MSSQRILHGLVALATSCLPGQRVPDQFQLRPATDTPISSLLNSLVALCDDTADKTNR